MDRRLRPPSDRRARLCAARRERGSRAAAVLTAHNVAELCGAERCLVVHQAGELLTLLATTAPSGRARPPRGRGLGGRSGAPDRRPAPRRADRLGRRRRVDRRDRRDARAAAAPWRRGRRRRDLLVARAARCRSATTRCAPAEPSARQQPSRSTATRSASCSPAHDETDPLTGARTRRGLESMLAGLSERGEPHALVLVDLDGAESPAGERFLVALAALLGRECRQGDVLARRTDCGVRAGAAGRIDPGGHRRRAPRRLGRRRLGPPGRPDRQRGRRRGRQRQTIPMCSRSPPPRSPRRAERRGRRLGRLSRGSPSARSRRRPRLLECVSETSIATMPSRSANAAVPPSAAPRASAGRRPRSRAT